MNLDFEKEVARNFDPNHPVFRDKELVRRLLAKTERLRVPMNDRRGNVQPETLLQFIARTLLSPHEVETLTVPELASRIASRGHERNVERHCDLRPKSMEHPEDDHADPGIQELLEKTNKFRKPGELLLEFVARTGIGPHQIRTSSEAELEKLVAATQSSDVKAPHERAKDLPHIYPQPIATKYLPQQDPKTGAIKFIPVNDGGNARYEPAVPEFI